MTQTIDIPDHTRNGDWWLLPNYIRFGCIACLVDSWDRPAIMQYRKERDTGGEQARTHPEWPERGWLVWWSCSSCGREFRNSYVTDNEVIEWLLTLMEWERA